MNIIRRVQGRLDALAVSLELKTGKLVPREPEATAFATHMPVLMALARMKKMNRILELGAGKFSTLTFLDKAAFPDLKQLKSVEDNPEWGKEMKPLVAHDSRCDFVQTGAPIAQDIRTMDLDEFDLIFVDNSMKPEQREETIREVSKRARRAVVAIHDFEYRPYQHAAAGFRNRYRFLAFHPNTGVAWNSGEWNKADLSAMDKAMAHSSGKPTDIGFWVTFLSHLLPSPIA